MTLKFQTCMSLLFLSENSLPVHRSETGILRHARACKTVASCDAWPGEASRRAAARTGETKGMVARTSGADWLHYWVSTFKGAHSLILPAHSGEVCVDHHANISRKVPLWPVCVGSPREKRGLGWIHLFPSSWEAWNKLMHAVNGNTAPAGASGDASGAYYLLCCNGLQYEGKIGFASCAFILI